MMIYVSWIVCGQIGLIVGAECKGVLSYEFWVLS
jgi:hypothetical protein